MVGSPAATSPVGITIITVTGGICAEVSIGAGFDCRRPAPRDSARVYGEGWLFGIGGNNGVFYKYQLPNGGWSGWQDSFGYQNPYEYVNGRIQFGFSSIVATTDYSHGWRLFGTGRAGGVYTRAQGDSAWQYLGSPDGLGAQQLAVGHEANNGLDLFALGKTNNRVYELVATGAGTSGFDGASFHFIHPRNDSYSWDIPFKQIAIARDQDFRQEVVGLTTWYSDVYTIRQTTQNGSWGEWKGLNGYLIQIAIGSTTDGRLEIFGIGANNALYVTRQTSPGIWPVNSWSFLGGYVKQIAVDRNQDGREEVLAIGADDTVYAKKQAAIDDAWAESDWFQVSDQKVKALATVLNTDHYYAGYGELNVAAINMDGSSSIAQQTWVNGGWY
jgi:hypothetical protein